MTLANHRSWQQHRLGFVHLTVEAEPTDVDRNLNRHRGLARVTEQLFELFDRCQLNATWAVGDPAHSAVAGLVAASRMKHSLALLGDRYWIGQTAGRTRFARELARRLSQARAAGIEVVTLVPRVAAISEHIDLVVKHELHAVVAAATEAAKRPAGGNPRLLHYGVWEYAASERLPLRSSWWPTGGWKLSRQLRQAARDAATVHFVIDASALEEAGRSASHALERTLQRVARYQARGQIQVETLAAAAARLSALPQSRPQRSILRAAA